MKINDIDEVAHRIYEEYLLEKYSSTYSIYIFIEEHNKFDWYSEYYDKAKHELRKLKIQKNGNK